MKNAEQPNYKELFERMEKAIDDVTTRLLDVYNECQVILEDCGERESPFSKESAEKLDRFVNSLRFEEEMTDDADYKKMYLTLFNAATSALDFLNQQKYDRAKEALITAQQDTEEIFLSAGET